MLLTDFSKVQASASPSSGQLPRSWGSPLTRSRVLIERSAGIEAAVATAARARIAVE